MGCEPLHLGCHICNLCKFTNVLFLTAVCPCATHSSQQPHCALFHLLELGCLPPQRLPSGGARLLDLQEENTPLTSTGLRLRPTLQPVETLEYEKTPHLVPRATTAQEPRPLAAGRECPPGRQGARCAAGGKADGASRPQPCPACARCPQSAS